MQIFESQSTNHFPTFLTTLESCCSLSQHCSPELGYTCRLLRAVLCLLLPATSLCKGLKQECILAYSGACIPTCIHTYKIWSRGKSHKRWTKHYWNTNSRGLCKGMLPDKSSISIDLSLWRVYMQHHSYYLIQSWKISFLNFPDPYSLRRQLKF